MDESKESGTPEFNVTTEVLRTKIFHYLSKERENSRNKAFDAIRFGLEEIKTHIEQLDDLNEKDVRGLASRIKRRKHATVEDMYQLSHAFLQLNANINVFANTPGALQIIVKELTGTNSERQISALECLCNLSLGEAHVCEKISLAAGSYLVTYLDSSEENLKRISLWTIANICGTSIKGANTLMQMKLISKLWTNYVSEKGDYHEDSGICLILVTLSEKRLLKDDDINFIIHNLQSKNPTSPAGEYHLQIIFNCGLIKPHEQFSESTLKYLIDYSLNNIYNFHNIEKRNGFLRIIYAVRILGNLLACQQTAYGVLLQQLNMVWQSNLSAVFNKLFMLRQKEILLESLWMLRNVLENAQYELSADSFLDKLHIPRDLFLKPL